MTVPFSYPYTITADTPAVASEVQDNFAQLLDWITTNYYQIDATPALTAMPVLPGTPTISTHATTKAYVDAIVPTGTISAFAGATAPSGYLLCDGSGYSTTGAQAALFAVIDYNYGGAAGTFNVPDLQERVPVGRSGVAPFLDLGDTGGEADSVLPEHSHTINHDHGNNLAFAITGGSHNHTQDPHGHSISNGTQVVRRDGTGNAELVAGTGAYGPYNAYFQSAIDTTATNNTSPSHSHVATKSGQVTDHSGSSGDAGDATITDKNYPPYVVVNYIIKT